MAKLSTEHDCFYDHVESIILLFQFLVHISEQWFVGKLDFATEGEADSSLEYWYAMHRWWFQKCYRKWGVPWEESAPIVKIYFERVMETAKLQTQ